jgi:hypothetical protein
MKLGEAMYKAEQEKQAAAGEEPKAEEDVIDGDFKEVDDDQRKSA